MQLTNYIIVYEVFMTKIKKEIVCAAAIPDLVPINKIIKEFNRREYTRVGKSYGKCSHFTKSIITVGLVATGMLFCFVPFCFKGFRNKVWNTGKEAIKGKEKTVHFVPTEATAKKDLKATRTWAKDVISHSVNAANAFLKAPCDTLYVSDDLAKLISGKELDPRRKDVVVPKSVKVFIKIESEGNEVKKIFSNNSPNESSISKYLEEIKISLGNEIDDSQSNIKKISFVTIFQDDKNELHAELQHNSTDSGGGKSKWNNNDEVIKMYNTYMIGQLGFPSEELF
jgi:hypothetical protein